MPISTTRVTPGPGQESVWDYPRPPRLEPVTRRLQVVFRGLMLADTRRGYRVLETSHPPVYYLPTADVQMELLRPSPHGSVCEWKGHAIYYDLVAAGQVVPRVAWAYPDPTPAFAPIRGYLAFYPHLVDECLVDGERAEPQPGGFYGGWITRDIVGPFKGGPGTMGW
jgi:uncharacterized protein (DUF427 family)